ncbi:ubiquitin-like protein [Hesseltinella vesiculosa]|uniref:Ubiquitin-like protein n=1 Tax=Hesseltinella vesiculosa TaxID=101127 RepID=A0A1X2GW45_9FUNG|nr:ubiquitin-like protein [Hesseltinella vesiculosa]
MATITNEQEYIDQYLKELSTRSVRFDKDYLSRTLPDPLLVKKLPQVKHIEEESTTPKKRSGSDDALEISVKILKPASQFKITRLAADTTILELKQRIYQQQMVPVKQQRLLLKGKVLTDDKTLADYQMTKDTTLHLMIKAAPASTTDDAAPAATPTSQPAPATLSHEARQTLTSDVFWSSIQQTLEQHLSVADSELVLSQWKKTQL